MKNHTDERARWAKYLVETPTYGTYFDRRQEYAAVYLRLLDMGLHDGDLIVDVGAGTCDFDRYLRQEARWNGRYWPIDGAVQGIDFCETPPTEYMPVGLVDWVVCIETIEHMPREMRLLDAMTAVAGKGVVVTTPNGEMMDVIALDPTHVESYISEDFYDNDSRWRVQGVTFSPDRPQPDTLIAAWQPSVCC